MKTLGYFDIGRRAKPWSIIVSLENSGPQSGKWSFTLGWLSDGKTERRVIGLRGCQNFLPSEQSSSFMNKTCRITSILFSFIYLGCTSILSFNFTSKHTFTYRQTPCTFLLSLPMVEVLPVAYKYSNAANGASLSCGDTFSSHFNGLQRHRKAEYHPELTRPVSEVILSCRLQSPLQCVGLP